MRLSFQLNGLKPRDRDWHQPIFHTLAFNSQVWFILNKNDKFVVIVEIKDNIEWNLKIKSF